MTAKLIKICQRRTAWRKIRRPGARHASCGPSHGAAVDPQAGPTAASRPGFHLADPATAVHHATSLTLQTRQPPPAMRPASPCSPGNRRPPCDQPHFADPATAARHATSLTLQPRQSPPAMRTNPPCRPGNRRPPVMPPFLHTDPTAAARRRRSLVKQTVVPRSRPCRPPPQPKGIEGHPEGPAVGRGRGGEGSQREGVAEGRDYGREGCNRKARSRIRQGPAGSPTEFFAGFVPFASLNIRFERVQTASQPYFYSRKRFTPRPHTHQIQPVAAPRQRSAPAGGSRDRHPLRLEDSLPFRPSVRHPETHGSGCRFVGS